METMLTRRRLTETHSARLIGHSKVYAIPRREVALDGLIDELMCAFFVAMAVIWILTTVAGIFS